MTTMTLDKVKTFEESVAVYEEYRHAPGVKVVEWCEKALESEYWSKQKEIITSVFDNKKTVVRACHSSSKTFTAADCVLAFLMLYYPCKIITTAPTFHQVYDLLWSEIRTRFEKYLLKYMPGVKFLQTRIEIEPDWFALGFSTKDAVNFTGFHQENVLVVFDEAPGVRADIVIAAETLGAGGNAHYLWIGNPTDSSGHFYNAFRSPEWNHIAIGYKDTPNFTGEKLSNAIKKELITPEWVESRRNEWGENSPLFIARCEGDFPSAGEKQVIGLGICEAAANRKVIPEGDCFLGVDVARFGDDLTVYAKRRGNVITEIITESSRDTMEIAGKIMAMHHGEAFREIIVDEIGIGAGVVDRLKEQGVPVRGLNVASKSSDDMYFNKRSEVWFNMADWLKYGSIPKDYELMADLTAPQYRYESNGKYRVEKKDETKKRLGRSPDRADAVILAVQATAGGRIGAW